MEVYWGKRSQGYSNPVNSEEVCVAVASHAPGLRLEESLLAFPELNARLRGVETTSVVRGSVSSNHRLKQVWRENIALIGDASGTVDAITGEGLGLSFRQAVGVRGGFRAGRLCRFTAAPRRPPPPRVVMCALADSLCGRSPRS